MVTGYVIVERLVAVAGMIVNALITRSANGACVRLIVVMEDVMVTRIVGSAVETVLALVIRNVIILGSVILIAVMESVTVMKIVSRAMIADVTVIKIVVQAQTMLILGVV